MLPQLTAAWQCDWRDVLADIEEARAAASLGQVHRAVLHDGRVVAIKIQYPGMLSAIQEQARVLGWLPKVGPMRRWDIDIDAHRRSLFECLEQECDYRREAAQQQAVPLVPGIRKAAVIEAWSTTTVLMQEWCPGQPLNVTKTWPLGERLRLGQAILDQFLHGLVDHGWLHGDLHFGNWAVDPTSKTLILYDYGACRHLSHADRHAWQHFLDIWHHNPDPAAAQAAFVGLGFNRDKLHPITDLLPQLGAILCQPFLSRGPIDLQRWRPGQDCKRLLGDHAWYFRSAGPPELLGLLRIGRDVLQLLRHLDVELDWLGSLQRISNSLERTSSPKPTNSHHTTPPTSDLQNAVDAACAKPGTATSLVVEAWRGQQRSVEITLPARTLGSISTMIPADLLPEIEQALAQEGTSLNNIAQTAIDLHRMQPNTLLCDLSVATRRITLRLR
jgi:hypothetical protein